MGNKMIVVDTVKNYLQIPDELYDPPIGDSVEYKIYTDKENGRIFLTFQDSNGKRDWINNLTFPHQVYKNQESKLLAHRGFARAYKSANDIIMTELIEKHNTYKDFDVVIGGWSHGGALTQLAVEDFNFRTRSDRSNPDTGYKPTALTIAAPKVFYMDKSIKAYLESCVKYIYFIKYRYDIVGMVPPNIFGFGEWGTKVVIGKSSFKNFWNFFNPYYSHIKTYADPEMYKDVPDFPEDSIIQVR